MSWQEVKAMINKRSEVRCKPRQVWWAYWGENIGKEQNGKGNDFLRPVLILQKFRNGLCFAIALTSKKHRSKYFKQIEWEKYDGECDKGVVIFSQAKTISTKRLTRYLGSVKWSTFLKTLFHFFSLLLGRKVSAPQETVPRGPSRGKTMNT